MERLGKIIAKLLIWCLIKAKKSEGLYMVFPLFQRYYQELRNEDLPLRRELIKTKKGKIKYYIQYFETPEGMLRCNIGRHGDLRTFDIGR